ncbi:[NiFe]-hydrogenase assembly chaperone HybE [Curvibacter fontanus]|uniref:[NiFe]-hydrogenase assembly chaperone HybE n=1 Tax=Hydrogenophaga sp. TaxID=1904254 RepID=UPI00271DE83D|nr:[NiFe]-hydrogenase assembly chaperone HybE [Hydrogenophaga sp.]MDO9220940.1 [NiFe]-hydrogenase assembly chaperone HybE [Thiobacillus sp.]MDP1619608.1 [NiFe]-hydrogenase assembly chaperone HybE [bacterium]MDP1936184.1 [NiFe]-hydrogenase assembly chaperone HybE [Hylemonella sp.]MDZ4100714.1 [NiFe]-hydrogenase assembly chaperone HybE [Hydrogenophaga sp.]
MGAITPATLTPRIDALTALFENVGRTRMAGVPILNPALRVEALGFELCETVVAHSAPVAAPTPAGALAQASEKVSAVGILITPWFMNLVWLPLERIDQPGTAGSSRSHRVGVKNFDFIASYEPTFGSYEACSLFSPMFEFTDHAAACATAQAVLAELRQPPAPAPVTAAPAKEAVAQAKPSDLAARRTFLFGRRPSSGSTV